MPGTPSTALVHSVETAVAAPPLMDAATGVVAGGLAFTGVRVWQTLCQKH